VGVLGGGTAGYFAALAIRRRFPDTEVTLIESSKIPIIGVGEATTTLMPPFLHQQLGLDGPGLFAAVRPTFKLGIRFEWGLPGGSFFEYPFGEADPVHAFLHGGSLRWQSLTSALMERNLAPVLRGPDGDVLSLLPRVKFAYHLENASFVAYLARAARERGIRHLDRKIDRITPREDGRGIEGITTEDGALLRFDFYIDATGFRSLVLGETLGSPFESYASSLLCDRAAVATIPQPPGLVRPYTTAETMDAGWCWRIPVEGEDHRGYVFSSRFLDDDRAVAEMRAKNPGMGEPWFVRFRSGRHRDFLLGNAAAVGNAYGFVEPLESTALHMVIVEIAHLLAVFEAMDAPGGAAGLPGRVNQDVGAHWDALRWFLALHYRHNRRLDTPFWRTARAEVDGSGLADFERRFRQAGPWATENDPGIPRQDPTFGWGGLMILLLGQRVPTAPFPARQTAEAWNERVEKLRKLQERALPQGEALGLLRADPALIRAFTGAEGCWVASDEERVDQATRRRLGVGGG
jgi:tryptophan halogenase